MPPAFGHHVMMRDAPAGIDQARFSAAGLIDGAAAEIVRRYADWLPNLSALTVLLPTMHAAAGFKTALRRMAAGEVWLLPRFATLATLAQAMPLRQPVVPASVRLVQLYSALKARQWFEAADLWRISGELAQLIDHLTRAQTGLPDSLDDFVRLLERAYEAKPDAAMRFEARLAHETWYALTRAEAEDATGGVSAAMAYALKLAALARAPAGPLCAVGLSDLAPAESAFLREYAAHQPVLIIGLNDTRPGDTNPADPQPGDTQPADSQSADPLAACLAAAWADGTVDGPPAVDIGLRARAFCGLHEKSPLAGRVALYGAVSLEDEALLATHEIKRRLAEGKRSIALVAADRLTARRVRALLERDDILLADESGWTLSTTSASTVLMRLLETLADNFYHRDVLDLGKSPFFAADWPPERRKRAVHRLEGWVRKYNIVGGLIRFHALVTRLAPGGDEQEIIRRLERAQARFKTARESLAGWTDRLLGSLDDLGATAGLKADAAGRQLIELLTLRHQELANHPQLAGHGAERVSLAEWRRWLNAELEAATFRDDAIDSPVVLTTLATTRLRAFDAAVVVGADAVHLSARPPAARLFNQSVRRELGLPGVAEAAAQMQGDLVGLIARSGTVLMTWQASKDGEYNAASVWLARLRAFHAIAYGDGSLLALPPASARAEVFTSAETRALAENRTSAETRTSHPAPAPSAPPALLPETISASAYGSLMACPYQFFARHMLKLNERDEVVEEMEKRDYGELVHAILARFHSQCPHVSALPEGAAEAALREITEAVFGERIENDYASLAWKLRWRKKIPTYLAWQAERERAGWRFNAAEEKFERPVSLEHGRAVVLKGRVDRTDRHIDDFRYAVLDYKTQKKKTLVDKLRDPGEDVQLAVYSLLLNEAVGEAAYVALDDEKGVISVPVGETLPVLIRAVQTRLADLLNSAGSGAPLPAQGASEACRFCEMRGLCRRDYWDVPGEPAPRIEKPRIQEPAEGT